MIADCLYRSRGVLRRWVHRPFQTPEMDPCWDMPGVHCLRWRDGRCNLQDQGDGYRIHDHLPVLGWSYGGLNLCGSAIDGGTVRRRTGQRGPIFDQKLPWGHRK